MKFEISTTWAVIIFSVLVTFGFVWSTYHKEAPFNVYSDTLLFAFLGVTAKRLVQKSEKFGGKSEKNPNGGIDSRTITVGDVSMGQQKD